MSKKPILKNRGALSNPIGRFEKQERDSFVDDWYHEEEILPAVETQFFLEPAKTIISKNNSPDLGFEQSINPYKGCEHGCIYCYARPSHGYANLSAGIDFETKIFYKQDAALLLEKELNKKNYICKPIVLGANTDPYQPIESKLKISRSLLEVLNAHNHPVIIITKNALVQRDQDILIQLAEKNLIRVAVSITSLSKELKNIMEPRTTTPAGRIKLLASLVEANIPVRAMIAPIIPFINDVELEKILEKCSDVGVQWANYILIRLPHDVKDLFKEWLNSHFPQRAKHIMSIIKQMRNGKEYNATFGKRMKGEGVYADLLAKRFQIACKRFNINQMTAEKLNTNIFRKKTENYKQLELWD